MDDISFVKYISLNLSKLDKIVNLTYNIIQT